MDRRKFNDVFTVPKSRGLVNICGVIGSGKTREEVVLQEGVEFEKAGGCLVEWSHRRGELWKVVKESVEIVKE